MSVDQYILRDPGRLYLTRGKSDQSDMFSGGYVFIDHASGYVSIKNQVAINATDPGHAYFQHEFCLVPTEDSGEESSDCGAG